MICSETTWTTSFLSCHRARGGCVWQTGLLQMGQRHCPPMGTGLFPSMALPQHLGGIGNDLDQQCEAGEDTLVSWVPLRNCLAALPPAPVRDSGHIVRESKTVPRRPCAFIPTDSPIRGLANKGCGFQKCERKSLHGQASSAEGLHTQRKEEPFILCLLRTPDQPESLTRQRL